MVASFSGGRTATGFSRRWRWGRGSSGVVIVMVRSSAWLPASMRRKPALQDCQMPFFVLLIFTYNCTESALEAEISTSSSDVSIKVLSNLFDSCGGFYSLFVIL